MREIFKYLLLLVLFVNCGNMSHDSNSEELSELYAQLLTAYNNEDLHGMTKYYSDDFESNLDGRSTVYELKNYQKQFILDNKSVSADMKNISISFTDKGDAIVSFRFQVQTYDFIDSWNQVDLLRKKRGNWEIISSTVKDSLEQ